MGADNRRGIEKAGIKIIGAGGRLFLSPHEPGKFVMGGKAALGRQLVDEAWQNLRQLRGDFLFGQTRLFGQGLDN